MTINKALASAIATGALLVNSAIPAFAVTLEVSGNGADSASAIGTSVTNTTNVVQSNTANISNNVSANSSSGGNAALDNTGGDTTVLTGDATVGVGISNTVNSNTADVRGCCNNTNADVLVAGNGARSDNAVELGLRNSTGVFQTNDANFDNNVHADAVTGENLAADNTGGFTLVHSGDARTTVLLDNTANANVAHVGGVLGLAGSAGTVSARILGNGADSYNTISLGVEKSVEAVQDNYADIENNVHADSSTGGNAVLDTTGGASGILSGNATTGVSIDNLANFNSADLDCGCLLDVAAKVAGNGAGSANYIAADLIDAQSAFQTNDWSCGGGLYDFVWSDRGSCNNVHADSDSGANLLDGSTNWLGRDPITDTGNTRSDVVIENTGNANVLGSSSHVLPFDVNVNFGLSWLSLWGGMGTL